MIKVLIVSHSANLNGAESSLLQLARGLGKDEFLPHIALPANNQGNSLLAQALRESNIAYTERSICRWVEYSTVSHNRLNTAISTLKGLRNRVWAFCALARRIDADVIYTNTVTVIEGALAARLLNKPHIWHIREVLTDSPSLMPVFPNFITARIVSALSRRIVVPGRYMATEGYPYRSFKDKLSIVHNGVDASRYRPSAGARQRLEQELHLASASQVVGIVGSLIPIKNHLLFLQAASLSAGLYSGTVFLIIGEGDFDYEKKLRAQAREIGLDGRVYFLGYRSDIHELMPAFDILALTSRQESFSRVVIEAMACGVPVVSTKCGGPEELIEDGVTGLLCDHDSHHVAASLNALLANPALRKEMGQAGRRRALTSYSEENYINAIENIIRKATNRA